MAIGNKQIGWSQESNLLWEISRQLDRMNSILCTGPCPTTTSTTTLPTTTTTSTIAPTTTTTTTSGPCNCTPGQIISFPFNYFDCQGVNRICTEPTSCRIPAQPCFDISRPYTGIEIFEEAPWICPPCS